MLKAKVVIGVRLFDLADGHESGLLSDEQFQFLPDHLESEDADHDNYHLNEATLQALRDRGGDPQAITTLQTAMAARTEMEIRWPREGNQSG